MKRCICAVSIAIASLGLIGSSNGQGKKLKGEVKADGSSTVYLITEAVASQFKKLHPGVNMNIGIAGTGGGFRKFANDETDIQNASRKMKDAEADACKQKGIRYIELQVAWDGLSVVLHKDNTFASKLTMEQLKKIWHPDIAAKTWKDIDPAFPAEKFSLWGAGKDSGTFDFFTEAVNGKERVIRQDYNASEDDNVIVKGVSSNTAGIGFFGVAYYAANKSKLNVAALGKKVGGPYYEPTEENVRSGAYPISRPLYIYVKTKSLERPEVREFVEFYLRRSDLVKDVGYVQMNSIQASRERKKFESAVK